MLMKNSTASQTRAGTKPTATRSGRGNGKPATLPVDASPEDPTNPYEKAALADLVDGPLCPTSDDLFIDRCWSEHRDEEVITWSYRMDALLREAEDKGYTMFDLERQLRRLLPMMRQLPALRQATLAFERIADGLEFVGHVHACALELRDLKELP